MDVDTCSAGVPHAVYMQCWGTTCSIHAVLGCYMQCWGATCSIHAVLRCYMQCWGTTCSIHVVLGCLHVVLGGGAEDVACSVERLIIVMHAWIEDR
jgi:hypothetical protein